MNKIYTFIHSTTGYKIPAKTWNSKYCLIMTKDQVLFNIFFFYSWQFLVTVIKILGNEPFGLFGSYTSDSLGSSGIV